MSKSTNPEVNLFIPQFTPSSSTQLATETFPLSKQRTIAQISELAKGHMGNILATVSSIQYDIPWFYIGCITCSSKVTPDFNYVTEEIEPGTFSCDKCKRDKPTSATKFKLQVRVVDNTGTASFLLFDNTLQKLIQKSVNDLLEEQLEFTRSGHFPQELLDLEGRNFVFKVNTQTQLSTKDVHITWSS